MELIENEEFEEILDRQENRCAGCNEPLTSAGADWASHVTWCDIPENEGEEPREGYLRYKKARSLGGSRQELEDLEFMCTECMGTLTRSVRLPSFLVARAAEWVESHQHHQDPIDLARRYQDAGMQRLHVVDLDGARSGEPGNLDLISELTSGLGLAVQIGGGIRDLQRVRTLLDSGASRVVIGSAAVTDPETVVGWINELGAERVVPAFDVKLNADGDPIVQTHGWTKNSEQTLWELMTATPRPARWISSARTLARMARWQDLTSNSTQTAPVVTPTPGLLLPVASAASKT